MQVKHRSFAIAMVALLLAACSVKYIQTYNVHDAPVPDGLTQEQVGKAIRMGTAVAGWEMIDKEPGLIHATYQIRAHTVRVAISYSQDTYSIDYYSSRQMKVYCTEEDKEARVKRKITAGGGECPDDDQPAYIHENYRVWIEQLDRSIKAALQEINE